MVNVNFSHPVGSRQFTDEEKDFLHELAYGSTFICEVGSWVGDSTEALGNVVKKTNGTLYCVDTFQGNPETDLAEKAKQNDIFSIFKSNIKELELTNYIKPLCMTSEDAVKIMPNDFFDFIFIDANHTYDCVRHDIRNWSQKLKSDGIIAGHDYDSPDFEEEFIHKDFVRDKHHGVIKAVNEFYGKNNVRKGAGTIWWVQK